MFKVLLLNAGYQNKGNEAIFDCTKIIIHHFRKDVEFVIAGSEKDDKQQIIPKPAKNAKSPYPWLYLVLCLGIKVLRRCGLSLKIPRHFKLRIYDDVDIVINCGGDHLSGEKFFLSAFLNIIYALLLGKPVVLFAESLGYYGNRLNRIISKLVFKKVALILVREELSEEYLLKMGVDTGKVYVTADPAFILPAVPRSRVDEILQSEDIHPLSKPIIGVNPSALISRYLDTRSTAKEHYIKSMAEVIDYLIETKGASILLIPHVYSSGNDDRETIREIIENISNKQAVFPITNEYSAAELKGVIQLCDMFIGARMHATIAATSSCIPTIGIAYSHKMHGIIGNTLKMEEYIIDINMLDANVLKNTVDALWADMDTIKQHLEDTISEVKSKALLNGHYFAEYLESRSP